MKRKLIINRSGYIVGKAAPKPTKNTTKPTTTKPTGYEPLVPMKGILS